MKTLLLILLLITSPSITASIPDQVVYGDTFPVIITIDNQTNVSITFEIEIISPYKSSDLVTVDPGSSKNYTFYITTTEYGVGRYVNVTVRVVYTLYGEEFVKVFHKDVLIIGKEIDRNIRILIGIIIVTLGVSVVGYRAMARRKKKEEEKTFSRPPRL